MEEQTCDVQSFFQRKEFYEDAVKYWDEIPATVDGMLGGFGYISHIDIMGSKKFLKKLFNVGACSYSNHMLYLRIVFIIKLIESVNIFRDQM